MIGHLVRMVHVLLGADPVPPVWAEDRAVPGRFAKVVPCPDCSRGRPVTVTPPPGYDAALLWLHDGTCPVALAGLRRAEGTL